MQQKYSSQALGSLLINAGEKAIDPTVLERWILSSEAPRISLINSFTRLEIRY